MIPQILYFVMGIIDILCWRLNYLDSDKTIIALIVIVMCQNFSKYMEERR